MENTVGKVCMVNKIIGMTMPPLGPYVPPPMERMSHTYSSFHGSQLGVNQKSKVLLWSKIGASENQIFHFFEFVSN